MAVKKSSPRADNAQEKPSPQASKAGSYNSVRIVKVDESSEGQRLDNFLMKNLKGVPKSLIYRIIRKGEVRINKGRAKPESKLCVGDDVRIPPVRTKTPAELAQPSEQLIAKLNDSVLYDSKDLMIVNKPAGLANEEAGDKRCQGRPAHS
jgi:23S rRNA pseudouridine955/2504/2580 synthase